MLEDLTIKDFALIDSDYLEFKKGFTVLSGETGAGKSILIGALSFLLGGKAETSQIRSGKSEASVSATFYIKDQPVRTGISLDDEAENACEWLVQHGIEIENNRVLLRRFIRDSGKSAAWIDNTPVTRSDLAQFSAFLLDIHGQHEHQSLMKVSEHRKYLDARAGILDQVEKFKSLYAQLVAKRKQLSEFNMSDSERLRKLDMMTFAVKEISEAKLKANEDSLLEDEQNRLMSYEKIYSDLESINQAMSDSDSSIIPLLKKVKRDSSHISELDKTLSPLDERLESAFYELSDIADEFQSYKDKLVFGGKVKGTCLEPTILDNVTFDDKVMEEEIFGPIMPIIEFDNLHDLIKTISLKEKPLAFYYFSKNKKKAQEVSKYAFYGGGCVNDVIMHLTNDELPFGGVGRSGMGSYHGQKSFETFSHSKSLLVKGKAELNIKYPPYNDKKIKIVKMLYK